MDPIREQVADLRERVAELEKQAHEHKEPKPKKAE